MTFSKRLRSLRNQLKLTQEELSQKTMISTSTISLYESGNREPTIQNLITFSNFFKVSIDYLVGLSDIPTRQNLKIEDIAALLNNYFTDKQK